MRAFNALSAIAILVAYTSAEPAFGFGAGNGCLTKHSAYQLVKNFIQLTNGDAFNETLAILLIAEDVVDTSGSVSSIINGGNTAPAPLTGPLITNRTEFIASNSAQGTTPYKPLNIYWTCDVITFRFEIAKGPFATQPVLGITILETIQSPQGSEFPFMIKQVFGELNSFAFLVDLGVYQPMPLPANMTAPPGRKAK